MKRLLSFTLSCFLAATALFADDAPRLEEKNVSYLDTEAFGKADAYRKAWCLLDLSFPTDKPGFATIIWLHGGGLTGGAKSIPVLRDKSIGVIGVGYRLSPDAAHPAYLEDAAAATAWTLRHVAERGGDPRRVFIAGHSAGGYLAAMIGMDPRWLAAQGLSNRDLAGIIPVSAQVTTHFQVKKLLGDTGPELRPIINDLAPLYYASKDLPPICLILGDRAIEYKNRVEENLLLAAALRNLGHPMVEFHEMGGLNHGSVYDGAILLMPGFVKRVTSAQKAAGR